MRRLPLFVLLMFAVVSAFAQPAEPVDLDREAVDFLGKLEAKNEGTTSLQAEFNQVRLDRLLLDTVVSDGKFWYKSPAHFHAHYEGGESGQESDIWMGNGEFISYDAGLKQVEIIKQDTGDDAAISQLLLGFGVKVEKIQKHFDIHGLPAGEGEVAVEFRSRSLDHSMGYDSITVYFNEEKVEPKTIVLVDDQSEITVELNKVKVNPKIEESVFEPKWPGDAEVLRYE